MPKAQHTPGPWDGPNFNGHYWDIFPNTETFGGNISVFRSGMTDAEVEANAHLIAAAPDLLAALEKLVDDLSFYNASGRPCLSFDNAIAVIAKAKGGAG